ncbi:MAG: sulfurtransferase [Planctomycetes bacterium]|nr:sulfurtransferase [Planctomycetota bacterium]
MLENDGLVILDATWHLPANKRSGYAEYLEGCIPGAQFFDYDGKIKDQNNELPRMLPNPQLFSNEVQKLGVNEDSTVIIYDANDMFSAPRAWWMFRAMGHQHVAVLNGGLSAWKAAGAAMEKGREQSVEVGDFQAQLQENHFVDAEIVLASIDNDAVQILDARSAERYAAAHMPSAGNRPYNSLLEDGKMKSVSELKGLFKDDIQSEQKMLCSCGSGVTACVIALAAEQAGHINVSVYDGSWSEWGSNDSFPKVES